MKLTAFHYSKKLSTSIAKIGYLAIALILSSTFLASPGYAHDNDYIVITNAIIKSSERHESDKNAVSLAYKSYRQTTTYTCGEAVIMMIMSYYGKLSPRDMNRATELKIANEIGAPDSGTTVYQVSNYLSNHGFSVDVGRRVTTDMIIENINKKIPIIIVMDQHWLVAVGYKKGSTAAEDKIIFADSCLGTRIIRRNDIDSMWAESQLPSNHNFSNDGTFVVATANR